MPSQAPEHHARIRLPPVPAAAAEARGFVAGLTIEWGAEEQADMARLLVSELVTNAVFHAQSPVEVRCTMHEGHLRVEVADADPSPPQPRDPDALDPRGRGLLLVDELSRAWGAEPDGGHGKVVWFEL